MNTLTIDSLPGTGINPDDRAAVRAKIAKADAEAAEFWHDDGWRREMAAAMTTTVMEGFAHENLLSLMAEVEVASSLADRIVVEEVRGLTVYWISLGGQIDQSRMTEERWELQRDYVGFHVSELEEKMESGFSRSSSNIISGAIEQMDAAFSTRLLRLYQAGIPDNTSPYYISGAGLSLPALNTAITEVQDMSMSDTITLAGRATMVNQIMDEISTSSWFVPETNEEIRRTGRLGTYRGANILRLKNFRDGRGVSRIPANEMWVLGVDAAKVGIWGGLRAQEWSEQGGFYWHYLARRTAGFALVRPQNVRRIIDTAISA